VIGMFQKMNKYHLYPRAMIHTLAKRGSFVIITFLDNVNLSRGIGKEGEEPTISKETNAVVCWMD